jgi:hypothetical protein
MDYYFVAKDKGGKLIGQMTVEEISRRFRAGELPGDYVATESYGPSYHELVSSGATAWITVADLAAGLSAKKQSASAPTYSQEVGSSSPQTPSRQLAAIMHRYGDAYLYARATVGIGNLIKGVGIASAILLFIVLFIAGAASKSNPVISLIVGAILGGIVGGFFYIWGILVSAVGQILKASLDGSVNTSPFLTNEHRAKIMSLPTS